MRVNRFKSRAAYTARIASLEGELDTLADQHSSREAQLEKRRRECQGLLEAIQALKKSLKVRNDDECAARRRSQYSLLYLPAHVAEQSEQRHHATGIILFGQPRAHYHSLCVCTSTLLCLLMMLDCRRKMPPQRQRERLHAQVAATLAAMVVKTTTRTTRTTMMKTTTMKKTESTRTRKPERAEELTGAMKKTPMPKKRKMVLRALVRMVAKAVRGGSRSRGRRDAK